MQAPQGREQVGAERGVRPVAALEHDEDLRERLGDEVVGLAVAGQRPGEAARGVDMAGEELAVRLDVAAPDGRDEIRVRGWVGAQVSGARRSDVALAHRGTTAQRLRRSRSGLDHFAETFRKSPGSAS